MHDDPIIQEFHDLIQRADSISRLAVETIGFITPEELDEILDGLDFRTAARQVMLSKWMEKYVNPYRSIVGCIPWKW